MAGVKDNTLTNVKEGSIVNFKAVAQTPLKSLRVNFNPIQQGEGDPSPENIRPISGWIGLNVYKGSNNFLTDTVVFVSTVRKTEMEYIVQNNSATIDRKANVSCFVLIKALDYITSNMVGMQFVYTASNYNVNDAIVSCNLDGSNRRTITNGIITTADVGKMLTVRFYAGSEIKTYTATNMQLSLNSTSSTYESYNGTTIPVSWSNLGTVYGGYVDIAKGKIFAEYYKVIINETISMRNFTEDFRNQGKACNASYWLDSGLQAPKAEGYTPYSTNGYSNKFIYIQNNYLTTSHVQAVNSTCDIVLDGTHTKEEFLKWLTENGPIEIIYKMAEPIQYNITPQEVKTLLGINNIYSNADSVSVEYYNLESLDLYKQRFKVNQPYLQTANGSVASFQTDLKAPLKECKVYFSPVQEGEGDPSPENIRPLSGWDGLDLNYSGKNLVHIVSYSASTTSTPTGTPYSTNSYGTTLSTTNPDESIVITQSSWTEEYAKHNYRNGYFTINVDNLEFGKTYKVSFRVSNIVNNPLGSTISNIRIGNPAGNNYAATDLYNDKFVCASFVYQQYSTVPTRSAITIYICGMSFTMSEFMVTKVDEDVESYEPFGTKNSITLPDTYYGGYVDLISGELTVTYGYKKFVGNENWFMSGGISNYCAYRPTYLHLTQAAAGSGGTYYLAPISDKLKGQAAWATPIYNCTINDAGHFYFGAPEELSTKEAVNTWIQEIGGIEVAYPLRNPMTYQLTPTQLKTLKGQNNIWSNANGNTQVKYWTHGSLAKRKTLTWNQWARPLTADYWQAQNSNYTSITFNNNEASITLIKDAINNYSSDIRTKYTILLLQNHILYCRQEIYSSQNANYQIYLGTDFGISSVNANTWTVLKQRRAVSSSMAGTSQYAYFGRSRTARAEGDIIRSRNPLIIDLTQMFGEGNEPTLQEFESLCARNGIDLTQYQPYDEGSTVNWYV